MSAIVTEGLVGFAHVLRRAGVRATPDRVQLMLTAIHVRGLSDIRDVYWAGRLTLCGEPEDLPIYDAAFATYFGQRKPGRVPRLPVPLVRRPAPLFVPQDDTPGDGPTDPEHDDPATVAALASDVDVLRHRDVATLSEPERLEVRRLIELLAPYTAPRATRRYRPHRRGQLDPRETLRQMLRQSGEPSRLARRRRRPKPRRLVLLLDVSGSMAPYADSLLRFGHAAARRRPSHTEVFTIGTRLTRITRALRQRDPDAALHAGGQQIPDWHGGTRLAESFRVFLDRWGRRGFARGAVVVIFSDGWERGSPAQLGEQLAQLSRLAYRVVWVNPHRGKPGFAPTTGGMAAVLPYLDELVAGHSLASLEHLAEVIARA